MESGRGPEFSKHIPETMDSGFSEKRAARVLEGKQTDNSQIKKRKPLVLPVRQKVIKRASRTQHVSTREKILAAHQKNAQALLELIQSLGLLTKDSLSQEEQLMMQIRARHKIQEQLLNALVLDSQGQLQEDTLPKELADLIK